MERRFSFARSGPATVRLRSALAGAVLGVLALAVAPADAGQIAFNFPLSGSQEVPPNNSDAVGAARLLYDTDTQRYSLDLMVFGIGLDELAPAGPNGTPVHVHMAPRGQNGPIVVDLGFVSSFEVSGLGIRLRIDDALFGGQQGNLFSDPDENEAALFAGNLYANVHTHNFRGGEIRGQIIPEPATLGLLAAGMLALRLRRR